VVVGDPMWIHPGGDDGVWLIRWVTAGVGFLRGEGWFGHGGGVLRAPTWLPVDDDNDIVVVVFVVPHDEGYTSSARAHCPSANRGGCGR
jgi:hypothetical protein